MKITIKNISIIAGLLIGSAVNAQDVHFSQMGYAPMNLNPALAGANGPLQGIANYRSQWSSVADPFVTMGASIDGRFNENKRGKSGIIAGGLSFFNDKSGDLQVTTTNVNLSLAYHLILDRTSTLGLGIYGGYGSRGIDPNDSRWGSQYDPNATDGYNSAFIGGESFNSPTFSYIDAGAGLVYTYKKFEGYMTQNNQRSFNGGIAFYHVNGPNFSFIENADEKLFMRYSIFFNGLIGIENSRGAFEPAVYFNRQKTSMEILYGFYYRYTLTEGSKVTGFNKPFFLHLGAFNRWNDAIIAKAMLEWYEYSVGFAYDFNVSTLTPASNARGGFELFLRYNMEPGGVSKSKIR
jgi:type IX secretion system PorP/SprF family membrane protein